MFMYHSILTLESYDLGKSKFTVFKKKKKKKGLVVLSDEPRQNQGRGLVDGKLVKAPK